MSQLDLSLAADVSARHISFLETGRSQPSIEMLLLLSEVLDIPLRDRNELLRAGGFPSSYPEPSLDEVMDSPVGEVLRHMLDHHQPFPMMIIDRYYGLVEVNDAASTLLHLAGVPPVRGTNVMSALFTAEARALVSNWDVVAGHLLRRVQREVLTLPGDVQMADLLASLLALPSIPEAWRTPDLAHANDPMVDMHIDLGETKLRMLTTITHLSAPSDVTLQELQIESYIPADQITRDFFLSLP